jgi:preprotein translocase subunit SecE
MPGSTANPVTPPRPDRQTSLLRYLRESRIELRKVSWPTREQVTNLTIVVIVVCMVLAAFLGILDAAFAKFITWIH